MLNFSLKDPSRIIKALGLVFGDIGTSPIYTFTAIFLFIQPSFANILGIASLILWTLILLVFMEYVFLAMSLSKKGEGGTIVLKEILIPFLKSKQKVRLVNFLAFIGVSLLIGDGVITPAISILSAVEGSRLIPGFEALPQYLIILTAGIIAIGLFSIQKKGTEKVAGMFGPIMFFWFCALFIFGLASILKIPQVILAFNPMLGLNFIFHNGLTGFFILSEVILCATGGEALYADMGHLRRKPITQAWYFVFIVLCVNYLGQAAFLIANPQAKNILFEMAYHQASFLYIPFLILSILATIIASQAMISGMFSIVYQGIATQMLPLFKIDFTSTKIRGQIYIGVVNWFLLFFILLIMLIFKESSKLAAAYGFAVTGTMFITAVLMIFIFYLKDHKYKALFASFLSFVALSFFVSNLYKLPHGGYWSFLIALIPFTLILIYTKGQRRIYSAILPTPFEKFFPSYLTAYNELPKIPGTALFFLRNPKKIPPYVGQIIFANNIIYEQNIFVSIIRRDYPFGTVGEFKEDLGPGLRYFEIRIGYMEIGDIERILDGAKINEKVIFYGLEDISTEKFIWKIFALIKKISPSYVQFYKLPSNKLHGVISRVELD